MVLGKTSELVFSSGIGVGTQIIPILGFVDSTGSLDNFSVPLFLHDKNSSINKYFYINRW